MSIDTLQKLLDQYRAEKIAEFSQITIGVSNEAYLVTCTSGSRYVIRLIILQTAESVRAEARIQQVMERHGMSTPVYSRLQNGDVVGEIDGATFTIAKFIDGHHPRKTTLKLVQSIGSTLAKLHNILDQKEIQVDYNTGQWLHPQNVLADIGKCAPRRREQLHRIFTSSKEIFEAHLPMAVIHGELASNNVFADRGQVTTVFDYETTQYAPRILDVTYSYLSVTYEGKLSPDEVFRALAGGYDKEARMKLTDTEYCNFSTALQYVSVATAAWCFSRHYDDYGEKFLAAGKSLPDLPTSGA